MKKITFFVVALFFAMTTFAAPLTGGMKLYFDFTEHALWSKSVRVQCFFESTNQIFSDATKLSDGVWKIIVPEGSFQYVEVACYDAKNQEIGSSFQLIYDGKNNLWTLKADAEFAMVYATAEDFVLGEYAGKEDSAESESQSSVAVSWSIKEGAVLESFAGVTVTFSGVDPVGRKLDGKEVVGAVAQGSSTNVLFYEVDELGNLTPVDNGTLYSQADGLSIMYMPTEDKGYKNIVDGAYIKQGNYRIIIDEGDVLFTPNRDGLDKVYNNQKYVLNFSIKNDYVAREFVDADYIVSPKNNSTLDEIREIEITFSGYESIIVKDTSLNGLNWLPCEYSVETEEQGSMFETKAPMKWSAVAGKPNALRIFVASEMFGAESIVDADTYQITISEGVVCFSETESFVTCNKEIILTYVVSGDKSSVESVEVANIYTRDGWIVVDGECQIFAITGQNVTAQNGNLETGVYIVKCNNTITKVVLK